MMVEDRDRADVVRVREKDNVDCVCVGTANKPTADYRDSASDSPSNIPHLRHCLCVLMVLRPPSPFLIPVSRTFRPKIRLSYNQLNLVPR